MGRRFVLADWSELRDKVRESLQGRGGTITLNKLYELLEREVDKETIRVWIRRGYITAKKRYGQGSRKPFEIEIKSVIKFIERFE
jgi:hypothetical protein